MLTIDIGNTRIKWGVWENNRLTETGEYVHRSLFNHQLFESALPELRSIDHISVANVAGEKAKFALEEWLNKSGLNEDNETALFFLKTEKKCCGVTNSYAVPSEHGVDRWAALIAARSLCETDVCVIDIGTAVTVDLMDDAGVHEGGMIMPGLKMMQKSLLENTADISFEIIDFSQPSQGFASNTEEAIQNGTFNVLRAGLDDICLQAHKHYGDNVTVFITGGFATKILPLLSMRNIIHEPHLVLKGLHIAANV